MNSTHLGDRHVGARNRGRVRAWARILSSLALLLSAALVAAPVSMDQAKLAVNRFLEAAPTPLGAPLAPPVRGTAVGEATALGATRATEAYAYVVALQPEGYVVVSGDDRITPIIAFSATGAFDPSMANPLAYLLAQDLPNRLAVIDGAATRDADLAEKIQTAQADWAKLTVEEGTRAAGTQVVTELWVDSFVKSKWSQSTEGGRACYNYYTPLIGETSHTFDPGNPDNIVSGCAATATAQMIRYFEWPQAGIGYKTGGGSVTYHYEFADPEGASLAGTQLRGGNGNGGPYDWAAMTLDPNGTESEHSLQQIGALCFDAGLALNMKYNIERSNMSGTNFSAGAFTSKFNYSGAGSAGGIDGMRANFDARRPVAITIGMTNPLLPPPGGGHAIVGDGYGRIDGRWYYHFNMGWGGGGDLWYNVEEYYYDSVAGGTEWAGLGASVGNVYRRSTQTNEDAAAGKIISGRVTDAAGNPVPGVAVEIQLAGSGAKFLDMFVWNELDGTGKGRNTTDENGIWAIDKVPNGNYDIVMSRAGLAFAGPKEVTVAGTNQWGLNFVANADNGLGELVLDNWYYDYDTFVPGAALVILEFNRPVGDVAVDPTALTLHSGANSLTLTGGVVFQSSGSRLVAVLLDPADAAVVVPWGGVALTLDMARDFLTVDVDGDGSQANEDDANDIPVAPLVGGGAENPGFPIDPTQPLVGSTNLLVDGAVLGAGANPHPTKNSPVQFLVAFSQPVSGVDADDFSLRLTKDFVNISTWPFEVLAAKRDTPLPSAAIVSVEATDAAGNPAASPSHFWTVTVNLDNGDGFLRLDVIDNDTITNAGGTALGGAGTGNGDYFYSEFAYRYDDLGPVIVAATLAADNTYVDIEWSEPVGSTNSLAKTSNFSDIVAQYAWADTNGVAGHDANDALWLDRSDTQDNTYRKREDVVLMEPPFTTGLADGQARTGQFKYIRAQVPILGETTIARVCYVELDGVPGCSAGDGLFLDVGEQAGFTINFDNDFTPGHDLWFWPSGTEPGTVTAGALVPDRTSYYAENGAIPIPDYADALDEYMAWIVDFYAGNNNGIWLDFGPADQVYTVGDITDGFVDSLVMGVAPADGALGAVMPPNAMYRDTNQNGLVDATDYIWLDGGADADALDGGDTRLDVNGEPLPGALFTHSLQVLLKKNGGTVTSVGISQILNGDGTPMTSANHMIRAMLKYTPDLDLGGTAPLQLNEHRIPAGVETIEIVPIEDNVFDALGNAADTQTTTGEMRLHDSSVPRIVNVILADDNYSAKVVFSERVYTNPYGISNHTVAAVPDNVGNLTAGDFTVTTNTGPVTITGFSHGLATNYCILNFGGTAAGRQAVDPAANPARTTLTVSVAADAIFDFAGNAIPATNWPVALRGAYNIENPDSMPPRYFSNGDNAYRKEGTYPTPAETDTVTDAAGLTYHGIYYRDRDGDCRVDAVDLNFRNPRPNSAQSPTLSVGSASAASKFRVWVQNSDPEDTSHTPAEENLGDVPNTDFTGGLPWAASADWTEIDVTGASVFSTSTYYSTIRVTIDQSQVRPRTHGKRWVMISYDDPNDSMDGIPPTTGANTNYEADGVHWLYVTPTPSGGTDPADWYWIVADFPPTMAWDGAPARPVAATMWRTANYNKSGESNSYNSYDYMDVVFSEPLSSVGDSQWTPGASYGSGTNVHQKEGPFGPEIIDLLSGTAQTVRIWFDNTSVTSRSFGGGSNSSNAAVVDAAGNRNATPHFTGTALGVRNLDSRYEVLGFRDDSAWVDMLAVDSSGASIQQYSSDSNSAAGANHTLNANRATLRAYDQGGFSANSDAYWRQSNNGASYLLAGIRSQDLANTNADIVFSAATNEGSVNPGDAFVAGITELRVRNTSLTANPQIPGMVANGIFAMVPPAVVAAGPVYCMAKVSAITYSGTSRLDERERAMLAIDVAGRTTDRIETIAVRVIDTSHGQFDPEIDLLPLADDATSGVRLYQVFGATGLVQLAAGGLEWSEWRINAEGQPYREVVLRPLASLSVPPTDLGAYAGAEYEIRVATSNSFNLGDSFIVEIPDDGILFQRRGSQDDFPSNWAIADGTPGLPLTGHVYRDGNGDGRWGMGETIMDIEDSFSPVPFYDAGVPYQHRTQSVPFLSVVGKFQRNLYYAKRGSAPNPDTDPEPPGATGGPTDTDYNVVYSPGDAVWYDISGTLGVYDAGTDIPLFSNSDLFREPLSPHEEGARSVQVRGAAPASVSSALPAGTIAAGSEPTAVLGIDMHDSGRGFAPRFPFGQMGGVVVEAVSKNLRGGVYAKKLVYSVAAKTLQWNGGTAVDVSTDGRYILEGAAGSFLVVEVAAASLPAANASVDVTISTDVGRDIQQPAAIRGLRIHAVGPGNVPGKTGILTLTGTSLAWQSDSATAGTKGAAVDVAAPGIYTLSAERTEEADYVVVQVDSIRGAAAENLAIYSADGRSITPLQTITGLEIMTVSDVVDQGNYSFTWDGTSALSWSDGIPTDVTGAAGRLTLVPGNPEGTRFVVVRRTSEPLPAAPAEDVLFVNQTRLLRVAVTVSDNGGFTSTHLRPLTADQSSGIALYRDANANGVFDGPGIDEFVPLLEAPVFSGAGNYTTTLYPDPAYRAAYLPNSHVAPHNGNDFFLAVQTTFDMSYGDRFSVSASVYEPTEPRDDLNGNPSFANGSSGTITSTSVTNTVYSDETASPWTIDAGRDGVAAPRVLFGIDHFLGVPGTIHLQSLTFKLHSANGFDPVDDLKAMDDANDYLRGVMLYADNGSGAFSTADTLIPCDIVTDYAAATGIYTFTLLPIASSTATLVPQSSDGGAPDHFVCLNYSSGLDYGDEFYATVEVDGIEYSSGVGNAAARLQTHNLTATIKSTYGDLTSRVQTTVAGGLLVTGIGSTVANGYHEVQILFDPVANVHYLVWNANQVAVDMLAVGSYTLGTGNNSITVTFDPFAFRAEDTLVDGDGVATTAAGVPDGVEFGDPLLPIHLVANLFYVDVDEDGYWQHGEPILAAPAGSATYNAAAHALLLGAAADGDPLAEFAAHDRLAVHDENENGVYDDGEDILRDTDGFYTLPSLDQLLDTDGGATVGIGGASLLQAGDELVSAHTVSVDAGQIVQGYAALYYHDSDASGGYTPGDDIVARPAGVGGVIAAPLTFALTDVVLYDGDDNGDGDDENAADEVQVAPGSALSRFVPQDYVAFERAGIFPDAYELREDVFRARAATFAPTQFAWNFRVTNGTRAIRRYEAAVPAPFNDPEDAMTAVLGIDLANSGATGVTLDRLTVRFDNLYQFNATIDLRALTSGGAYAGADAGALLYRDADGNGLFDPEIDTLVQPASAPAWTSAGSEYRVTFNLDSDNLVASETLDGIFDFFVVVQPSAAANNYQRVDDGDRFRARIANGDMVLSKALNTTSITGATIVIDSLPPQLTVAPAIADADADGHLDSVTYTFHEPLQPGKDDAADWAITGADGSDLSPPTDAYLALNGTFRTMTVNLTDINGTTGRVNTKTTYDADRLGLFDWAGNPVDFGDDGVESADAVPPLVRHSGIQLYGYWSAAAGTAGIPGDLWYRDRNGNGQWDAGEDIWQELGGTDGQYDEGIDRRIWNGGKSWSTVDGYNARASQGGICFHDENGNGMWDAYEAIWIDRDTDTLDGEGDLDGANLYDEGTDLQIFPRCGEEVEVHDLDRDGRVDALRVALSEKVDPATLAGYVNHWTNFAPATWTLEGRTGLQIDPNGPNDLPAASMDARHVYFVFAEVADDQYDTGAVPGLTTAGATLRDLNGNVLNGGANYTAGMLTVDDQALPMLVGASGDMAISGGNILAGTKITLTFSERMAKYTDIDLNDFETSVDGVAAPLSPAFEDVDTTVSIDAQGRVVITFNEATAGANWTEDLTIGVKVGRADHCVGDLAGHNMAEGAPPVRIRGMGSIVVTEVLTLDTDANGFIDAMRIVFDRPIDDATLAGYTNASTWIDVAANGNHFQVAGRDGTVFIDPNGPDDDDAVGNDVLYLVFDPERETPDTGAKPALTIAADCPLRSFDNEPVDVASVPLPTDGAAPQVMDVSAYDQDADGNVDTVRLDFSEAVADATVIPGDYTIGGKPAVAMDSILLRSTTPASPYTLGTVVRHGFKPGDQVAIGGTNYAVATVPTTTSFTVATADDLSAVAGTYATIVSNSDSIVFLSTAAADQAVGSAYQTVAYAQNLATIPVDPDTTDKAGNLLADRTDAGLRDRYDYAPPVVIAAESRTDSSIAVTFSEFITSPDLARVTANSGAIAFAGVVWDAANTEVVFTGASATWNTGATGMDGDWVKGTNSSGTACGDVRTDLRFASAAVRDLSGQANPNALTDFDGTADGVPPVVISVGTYDTQPDGMVDQAAVVFSEQVQSVVPAEFRLGGVATDAANTGDNYSWTFDVAAQVPGTAYAPLAYLGPSCRDAAGNLLLAGADLGINKVDQAKPILLQARTADDRTVRVTFSEPIENGADEIAQAVASSAFALDAATTLFFGESLVDLAGTPTTGQGSLASFYLRMTDGTTWNTDATGADAGLGFDANGAQQAVLPQIHMAGAQLDDASGNPADAAAMLAADGAPPVVIEATTAAAQRGSIFGLEDNIFVKVLFSEALKYSDVGGAARLTLAINATDTANVLCTGLESDVDSTTPVGLDRALAFTYTVRAGDNRVYPDPGYLEYPSTASLVANGASVQDGPDNHAVLALPAIVPDGTGASLSRAMVELDTLPPEILAARTVDHATVEVTFTEPVARQSILDAVAAAQIRLSGGAAYDEVTQADGSALDAPGSPDNYTVVYLRVTDAAKRWNTDATGTGAGAANSSDATGIHQANRPLVDVAGGILKDRPGNLMLAVSFDATTDGAPPVATASSYHDTDTALLPADGRVDYAFLRFSEPVSLVDVAGWTLDPRDLGIGALLGAPVLSGDTYALTFVLDPQEIETGVEVGEDEPLLSFDGSGGLVDRAAVPNALVAGDMVLADAAGPAIRSAAMVMPNMVEVTFSETVDPATLGEIADFVHGTAAVTAVVAVDGGAKARLTLDSDLPLDNASTVAFAAKDVVADGVPNWNQQVATVDVAPLGPALQMTTPPTDIVQLGAAAVNVQGLVNVAATDLTGWQLFFAEGHLATPLEDEAGWVAIGGAATPVALEDTLGAFSPDTHADSGSLRWTLVLRVTFANASVATVYREIFVSSQQSLLGEVIDGDGPEDVDFQLSTTTITATWTNFDEGGLDPVKYEMAVGTNPLGNDVADWTDMGTAGTGSIPGLGLLEGIKYYASVRALDGAGNMIGWQTSDGVIVDLTGPAGAIVRNDMVQWQIQNVAFGANWDAFVDPLFAESPDTASGVASYQVAVFKMLGETPAPATDTVVSIGADGFVDVGDVLAATLSVRDLNLAALEHGAIYYAAVRCVDAVGNTGAAVAAAEGVTIDILAPVEDDALGATPNVYLEMVNGPSLRAYWDPFVDEVSGPDTYALTYQHRLVAGDDPTPWTAAAQMSARREKFTSVLLADGRLLVAGGWDGTKTLGSVEVFDPATGTWALLASMNTPRMNASGILLPDGRVLVGGGESAEVCLDTLEVYDPAANAWTALVPTFESPRTQATVALVDGSAWFMGGRAGGKDETSKFLDSIEQVEVPVLPGDDWLVSALPVPLLLSEPRYGAKAVTLNDGRILVIGGETGTNSVSATVDAYDPQAGTWSDTDLAKARGQFAVCHVPGTNQVLVMGGLVGGAASNSVEFFDGNAWQEVASMATARYAFPAAWVDGAGQILVAGGYGPGGNTNACETYDPAARAWTPAPALTGARYYHGLAAFENGLVLVYGGRRNYAFSRACETSRYPYALSGWGDLVSNATEGYLEYTFGLAPEDGRRYIAQVRATDDAGNTSAIFSSAGLVADLSVPSVVVTAPAGPTNVNPLVFHVEFSKPVSGFANGDLTIVNGTVAAFDGLSGVAFDIAVTPTADGQVSLTVDAGTVTDDAGNPNTASNTASVVYMDAAGPTCELVAVGGIAATRNPVIPFTATFSHEVQGFEGTFSISVQNGRVTTSPASADGKVYTFTVTATTEGDVKVQVKAAAGMDAAGNFSQASALVTVAYDLTPPVAELVGAPADPTNQTAINVTVGGDGVATYTYSLDGKSGGDPDEIGTHIVADDLEDGEHTLLVWGIDAVGNKQLVPTEHTWTVDTVAPVATLTSLSGTTTFENPIRFRMAFDKAMADFTDASLVVPNGTVVDFVAESATVYTFGVQPTVARGYEMAVTVTLPDGAAHDVAGNPCAGVEQTVSFFTEPPAQVTLVASAAQVAVGESFEVRVYVKERSDAANGFRGGPLDLQFTPARAELGAAAFDAEGAFVPANVLDDTFTQTYVSGTVDKAAGLIDELGGGTTADNLGEGELDGEAPEGVLYATLPFVATTPGAFTIAAAAAEAGLSLTPPVGSLPAELVDYGSELVVLVTTDLALSIDGSSTFSENGGQAVVRVALAHAAIEDVAVQLALGGAAVHGTGYTVSPATIVIRAGQTSAVATFTGIDDDTYKGSRSIVVGVDSVSPVGYQFDGTTVELTLTDDDAVGDLFGNDGIVNFYDFMVFTSCYGTSTGQTGFIAAADLSKDGVINFYDFSIFVGLYGTDYNVRAASSRGAATREERNSAVVTLVAPDEVTVGESFTVDVYVQTDESTGLASAILDVSFAGAGLAYDGIFASATAVQAPFNATFTNGELKTGLIDELGGATTQNGLGYATPVLFAKLRFVAAAAGTATFGSAAGEGPFFARSTGQIPDVTFGGAEVSVVANVPPVADDLNVETYPGVAVDCALSGSDANGDVLAFALPEVGTEGYPGHGTVAFARDGVTAVYTPDLGFTGTDSFTFSVSDGNAEDTGTVTVFVGGFQSQLLVRRDGGLPFATLTYGCEVGASDAAVRNEDVALPVLPGNAGAYFRVEDGFATELGTDLRPLAATTVWQLVVAVPANAARETWQIAWDGNGLPADGAAVLMPCGADWVPTGEKVDLRAAGTLDLANDGGELREFRFLLVVAERVQADYRLAYGWNLIGVPLHADADSIAAFFADERIWTVYEWSETGGYTIATTLEAGRGYWVFAGEEGVELPLVGIPQVGAAALVGGWNLVAGTVGAHVDDAVVVTSWTWNPESLRYSRPVAGETPANAGVWIFLSEDALIWTQH